MWIIASGHSAAISANTIIVGLRPMRSEIAGTAKPQNTQAAPRHVITTPMSDAEK